MKNLTLLVLISIFTLNTGYSQVSVSSISPTSIYGGMGRKVTINGSGFGASRGSNYVSFYKTNSNYMSSSEGNSLNYISWSNTKIELEMPQAYSNKVRVYIGGNSYSSADSLSVLANLNTRSLNPRKYYHLSTKNNGKAVVWHIHKTYWDIPAIKTAIEEVFKEFRCKTGVNYILATSSSTAPLTLSDNINLIAPKNTGLPGYNRRSWSSCGTFYSNRTQDIEISSQLTYYYGTGAAPSSTAKFRYILMHELGHSIGLGHVNEHGQTMFPSVTASPSNAWSQRDTLTIDEKIAGTYYVNLSKGFTSPGCNMYPLGNVIDCNDVYGLITDIEEEKSQSKLFKTYPNPTNGLITMETDVNIEQELIVYDVFGRMVKKITLSPGVNKTVVDMNNEANGVYYAVIKRENGVTLKNKFIVH